MSWQEVIATAYQRTGGAGADAPAYTSTESRPGRWKPLPKRAAPRASEDDRRKPPSAGAGVRRIIMTADQGLLTAAPHPVIL